MNNHFPAEVKQLNLYSSDDFGAYGQTYFNISYKKQELKLKKIKIKIKKLKSTRFSGVNIPVFII